MITINKRLTFRYLSLLFNTAILIFPPATASSRNISPASDANSISLQDFSKTDTTDLAKTDHIAFFKTAIANYGKTIDDYTGTFQKQERIGKGLGRVQVIAFKFREKPYSVFMKWLKNPGAADRLLYPAAPDKNTMMVHPTGLLSLIKSVNLDPRGKKAMSTNLKPCDMFGFRRSMLAALEVYEKARQNGDLTIKSSEVETVDGRQYITLERILPEKEDYPAARLLVKFDLGYLLPVEFTSYDWKGQLISRYTFSDLKFNTDLKDSDFTPKANNL